MLEPHIIESKAEAASTIAEAEIAVKSMQSRIDKRDRDQFEVFEKAKRLLDQSTAEFKARNFGGAFYLAVQSKNQTASADNRFKEHDEAARMAGEIPLRPPLAAEGDQKRQPEDRAGTQLQDQHYAEKRYGDCGACL
jgi:hypothetical protein